MAESTSTTPDYSLDTGVLQQVAKAGIGGDARDSNLKVKATAGLTKGLKDGAEAYDAQKEAREAEIKAASDKKLADAKKFDTAFDAMGERGGWASGDLYDDFFEMESTYKDAYLEAVRIGDSKEQEKILKEQGARSNSLQNWKGTMETAALIDKEYGWGEVMTGQDDDAVANREILQALAENKGAAALVMDPETGEMGFELNGRIWTRREIDDIVATGTMPVVREEGFMTAMTSARQLGAEGKDFEEANVFYVNRKGLTKELRANESSAKSIMRDRYAGETSLAEDLTAAIGQPVGGIEFDLVMPAALMEFDTRLVMVNGVQVEEAGDGRLTAADLTAANVETIIAAIQADPKLLADVAADWMTNKMKTNHETALNKNKKTESLNRYYNMTADQKNEFQASMTPEEWLKFIIGQ